MIPHEAPGWRPTSPFGLDVNLHPPSTLPPSPTDAFREKRASPSENPPKRGTDGIANERTQKRPREAHDEDTISFTLVQHSRPNAKRKCLAYSTPCRDRLSNGDTLFIDTTSVYASPNEGAMPSIATLATVVPLSTPTNQVTKYCGLPDEVSSPMQYEEYSPAATVSTSSTRFNSILSLLDGPGAGSFSTASRCSSPLTIGGAGDEIEFDNVEPFNTRGHYCDLFLGTHRSAGQVALKRLRHRGSSADDLENLVQNFKRESNIWMGLRHPHILKCLGAFTRKGCFYLVSPFMKNGTLLEFIHGMEYSGIGRLRLIQELSGALRYLHSAGIVHGDVKANNVLMSDDLHVKLCDFGLTKLATSSTATSLKGAGSVRWQSPELWDNNPKTFKSDVYAYSMTIVEVLTGQSPFADIKHDTAVMMAIHLRDARPARTPETSLDGRQFTKAWDVAEMCWCRSADKRISMAEAAELLRVDAEHENAPSLGEPLTGPTSRLPDGQGPNTLSSHQFSGKEILPSSIHPPLSRSPLAPHRSLPSITSGTGGVDPSQSPSGIGATRFDDWDNRDGRCPIRLQ